MASTGLARALDYVSALGMDAIQAHERDLTRYALDRLRQIPGMRILGEADDHDAVVSFLVGNIHHLDMGTLLDRLGIAVRTGHHCAEPLMRRFGVEKGRMVMILSCLLVAGVLVLGFSGLSKANGGLSNIPDQTFLFWIFAVGLPLLALLAAGSYFLSLRFYQEREVA